VEIPGAGRITYVGRPYFICADGVRIWADSAVAYSGQNMSHLIGRVRYQDRTRELRADEARYFSQAGRLQANGNVVLRDTIQGSEITNGDLVLLRGGNLRDQDQITVTTGPDLVRPVATMIIRSAPAADTVREAVADTAAVDAPPPPPRGPATDSVATRYVIHGDQLFFQGSAYFRASGSVVVEREALLAFADTVEYDQVAERMLLRGDARVRGERFTMSGQTVNIALPGGEMRSVRAVRDAVLTGEDLRVDAPLVQMIMDQGAMQRLVATPLPGDPATGVLTAADSADRARPVAVAEGFRLTADSLDVVAPAERLERMVAVGKARGETSARDSLNVPQLPEVARTDWMEGDTLIATFSRVEPGPDLPPDTAAAEYRLERVQAIGSARTLYRFLPEDTLFRAGVDAPGIHYATGSRILIVFLEGEVDRMEMEGPSRGWHLEPAGRRAARDSLAPPDSGSASPDSGAVVPPHGDGAASRAEVGTAGRPGPSGAREGSGAAQPAAPRQRERGRRSRR
jgi:lipopolysaccharide export system protein LptA